MATKVCKTCGRELDETMFKMHRSGNRNASCRECVGMKMVASARKTKQQLEERRKLYELNRGFYARLPEYTHEQLFAALAARGFTGVVSGGGRDFNISEFNV